MARRVVTRPLYRRYSGHKAGTRKTSTAMTAIVSGSPAIKVAWMFVGGVLVGFGTRLGGGCTSGHGVCGTARGSARSVAATLTFMATGFLTVFATARILEAAE